ncbi:MAG: ECF transporter S component [Clostridiales bacterium]|nr:ECF transporter S component [Clostridiales bacterium]
MPNETNNVTAKQTTVEESKFGTKRIAKMAIMAAVALLFSFIPNMPMLPGIDFIRYEFSDLPILISAFAVGTPAGLIIAAVSILLNFLLGGAESGPYGIIMHFIAIGSYVVAAGLIYQSKKTMKSALVGMLVGIVVMTAVMIPANLFITPVFMGAPRSAVISLLLPAIIPINLLKGLLTAILTFILYKRVSGFLHR